MQNVRNGANFLSSIRRKGIKILSDFPVFKSVTITIRITVTVTIAIQKVHMCVDHIRDGQDEENQLVN